MECPRPSATKAVKKFAEWGLINVRSERNLTYYSINPDSPIAKNIIQLNNLLIEKMLGEETLYQIHENLESKKALVESTAAPSSIVKKSEYRIMEYAGQTDLDECVLSQTESVRELKSYTCQPTVSFARNDLIKFSVGAPHNVHKKGSSKEK